MRGRLRRLALALAGLGGLLAYTGPLRAGDVDFPICGDGVVQAPIETCDDGNTVSGDGCSGMRCLGEECGDGIFNPEPAPGPQEECEDGNTVGGDGCDESCELECGNGTLDGAEACDTGGESPTCDDDCTPPACGDGNLNEPAGERCDDANTVDGDGCEGDCTVECATTTKGEVACVFELGRRLAGVARARSGDDRACLAQAAAGGPTLANCLGLDPGGKVAKATQKTLAADARKCAGPNLPYFAYTSAATVNATGEDAAADAFTSILGGAPAVALRASDRAAARCQTEVLAQHQALLGVALGELTRATREALHGSRSGGPACSARELATALAPVLTSSPRVARAVERLRRGVRRRCSGVDVAALFDCGGATSLDALQSCVQATALRTACEATAEAEALLLDCA